jgi:hypothetical protein
MHSHDLLLRAREAIAIGRTEMAGSAQGRNLRELERLKRELSLAERKLAIALSDLLTTPISRSET